MRKVDGRLREPTQREPLDPKMPRDLARRLAHEAAVTLPRNGTRLSPTGRCHDCDRPVSGERRFCGPCLTEHGRL